MSKLHKLMKTLPRLSQATLKKGAPRKTTARGMPPEGLLIQLARYASAIRPHLVAIEWLETIANEQSLDAARNAFTRLSDTGKAIVVNGYLIKNNGKYRFTFDDSNYCSRFVVLQQSMLKSPYEFPVTTLATLREEVMA
ncbi:hypothetical protein SAMN05446927_4296 [Caballeronia arationis]|uniref:Uncharacterized protein n=1 Tax=Caballeronia arationis TaxID=1777142 RepID=A0A7Z7N3M8_9BURK|nr:hypothetical protein [Caballeronia arationis]SOE81041.1 hypothetical protein SAMN05446927_4296 [Caballeronia arationis]